MSKTKKDAKETILQLVSSRVGITRQPVQDTVESAPVERTLDAFDLLQRGDIRIQFSDDPKDFAFFQYNRECNPNHLKTVQSSLKKMNLLPCNPIIVMEVPDGVDVFYHDGDRVEDTSTVKAVTDGQHRYGAELVNAYEEGRPFRMAYIVIPSQLGDAAEIMKLLNTANRNWNKMDHIINGARAPHDMGNPNHKRACERVLNLINNYDWILPTAALTLCGITTSSLKRGTACASISPEVTATILREIERLVAIDPEFFKPLYHSKSVGAYIQVRDADNFDFDRLYEALDTSFNRNTHRRRASWVTSHSSKTMDRRVAFKLAHNDYTGGKFSDAPDMAMTRKEMERVGAITQN